MSAVRSRTLAARLWWVLLPYAGEVGYRDKELEKAGEIPRPRWRAYPLSWLWTLIGKLPSSDPFEPFEPPVCGCDFCRGVPGARFEP